MVDRERTQREKGGQTRHERRTDDGRPDETADAPADGHSSNGAGAASVLVADVRLSDGPVVLDHALTALPEATFVPDHHTLSPSGTRTLYLDVTGASPAELDAAFARDSTVDTAVYVDTFPDAHRYRLTLSDDALLVGATSVELGARIRSVRGRESQWRARLELPRREALVSLRSFCEERGVSFGVDSLYRTSHVETSQSDLTDTQWETLRTAFESGYYEVPRDFTQRDLAEELGVSTSAVSHRLRRATAQLLRESFLQSDDR